MKRKALLLTLLMALAVPLAAWSQTVQIPYNEDFESYSNASINGGVTPTGWTVTTPSNTVCEVVPVGDGKQLRIGYTGTTTNNPRTVVAQLPTFTSNINVLKINFSIKANHTSGSALLVGYFDRNNAFQPLETFSPTDYQNSTFVTIDFNRSSVRNNIVIEYMGNTSNTLWLIDNVEVEYSKKTPNSLAASDVTGTTASLSWSLLGNAEGYELQYADNSNFTDAQTETSNSTSITLTDLIGYTTYYAKVRSVYGSTVNNNLTYSGWSDVVTFTTDYAIPTNVLVTSDLDGVTVSWDGDPTVGYHIEYYNEETFQQSYNGMVVTSGNSYTFTGQELTPLIQGMRYRFRVAAQCDPSTASDWSDWVSYADCPQYMQLPLHANFDYMPVSPTNTENNLPGCWTFVNASTDPDYQNYPLVENNQSLCHSNYYPQLLYNYVHFNIPDDGVEQYLIFPPVDPVNGVTIKFYARNVDETNTMMVYNVGLLDKYYTSVNSFWSKDNFGTYSDEYTQYTYTFTAEELYEHGTCITIMASPSPGSGKNVSFCIDDIDIYPNGYHCGEPVSVHAENITATTAEIVWQNPETGGGEWGLKYKKASDTEWTIEYETGIVPQYYLLDNLEAGTLYDVAVINNCNDVDHSEWVEASFTTLGVTPVPTNLAVDETNSGNSWVTLTWECTPVTGQNAVSEYRIELSEDGETWHGPDWTANTISGTVNQSLIIPSIDRGQHYFHVQVVDDQNNEGAWSEPQPFTIEGCNTVTNIRTEDPTETYTFTSAYLPECWTITGDRPDRVTTSENALGFDAKGGNVVATCVELEQICVSEAFSGLTVSFDWRHLVQDMNNTTQVTVQLQYCLGLENENWQDAGEPISLFEEMGEPYWSVDPCTRIIPYDYWTRLRFMFTVTDYQAFNYGLSPKCAITNLTLTGRDVCSNPPGWHVGAPVTYNGGRVFWGKVDAALSYDVRYRAEAETEWTTVEGVEGIASENNYLYYDLTGLQPATDYRVQVKSECSNEWPTNYAAFTTSANPCTAPTVELSDGYPKLSQWVYLTFTSGYAQYQLGVKENDGEWMVTSWGEQYNAFNVTPGSTYQVKMRGYCGDYEVWSDWSEPISFTIPAGCVFVNADETNNWMIGGNWLAGTLPTLQDNVAIEDDVTVPNGYTAYANSISFNTIGNNPTPVLTIADGGQVQCNENFTATMKKTIVPYPQTEHVQGYYLIASPLKSEGHYYTQVKNLLTVQDGNPTYDFYQWKYYEDQEWRNYRAANFIMQPQTGYLYANKNGTEISFVGLMRANDDEVSKNLSYYDDYSFGGWYLLGNPFACNAYINADHQGVAFYRLNADGDEFEAATGAIYPAEGFFVQVPSEVNTTKIHINREQNTQPQGKLNINLTRDAMRGMKNCDNAIIVFGEGYNLGKFSFKEGGSRIYMPYEGQDCAAVFSTGLGEIPVNFKAEKNGTYTLNFNAVEVKFTYLHLIDNLTGADVDLLQQPEYTFDARTNDYASRFKVVFVSKGEDAAVDNETFAFNSNGNWIIANEGRATLQVIDINGRILSSEQINGCAETRINAAAGVYVIRLVNGENVRTQKVIVK